MKARWFVPVAALLSSILLSSAATAGVRDERPNLIGGEVGGRGLLFTLNYERFLSNEFGLGAGLMAIKTSGGGITMIPLYASFTPGNTHSPYLSLGATLLAGGGDLQDWESTWVVSLSAGYQYHSAGGFFVRPFFTYLSPTEPGSGDAYLVWPGLTIGGSF
jgi:hypothetical protein